MVIYGRSIIFWIAILVVAVIVFLLCQWALPLLLAPVVAVPARIVNLLAFLIALGVVLGGYRGVPAASL